MARRLKTIGFFLLFVGLGGFLFAWSGLYNVAASAGHWAITRWFLTFGMENSVETQSVGVKVPPLDDLAMIQRGASHYFGGCMSCHGAPGEVRSVVAKQMLPAPPYLPDKVDEWRADELFWIVKHGLKYTGMPAWAAQERDDEVWSVVAFLARLPEIGPDEYRELTQGEQASGTETTAEQLQPFSLGDGSTDALVKCIRCHGSNGTGRGTGAFPRLAGQSAEYLYSALQDYALGLRPSGIMQPIAADLTEEEMRTLAAYYAGIEDAPSADPQLSADREVLRRGEAIAAEGISDQGIPACANCHGPTTAPRNPRYPSLSGQYASYIAQQLRLWKQDARGNTEYSRIMAAAVRNLDEEDIEAVSLYYERLQTMAPDPEPNGPASGPTGE